MIWHFKNRKLSLAHVVERFLPILLFLLFLLFLLCVLQQGHVLTIILTILNCTCTREKNEKYEKWNFRIFSHFIFFIFFMIYIIKEYCWRNTVATSDTLHRSRSREYSAQWLRWPGSRPACFSFLWGVCHNSFACF